MINTEIQMTIQRSSSWAINYKDVCLSHNHSYTRRQSESTQVSAPMQACVQKSNLDQILIKIFALQWDELRLYCDKMSNSSNRCLHWVELWGEQLFKTLHPWFASTDSNFCAHRHFIVSRQCLRQPYFPTSRPTPNFPYLVKVPLLRPLLLHQ